MREVIRLNESEFRELVSESVARVIDEMRGEGSLNEGMFGNSKKENHPSTKKSSGLNPLKLMKAIKNGDNVEGVANAVGNIVDYIGDLIDKGEIGSKDAEFLKKIIDRTNLR